MKSLIPWFHGVKAMIMAIPHGEHISKATFHFSSLQGTYASAVGKPVYFTALLFLKQDRFLHTEAEDLTSSQAEDTSNVIFVWGTCLQLNIILP